MASDTSTGTGAALGITLFAGCLFAHCIMLWQSTSSSDGESVVSFTESPRSRRLSMRSSSYSHMKTTTAPSDKVDLYLTHEYGLGSTMTPYPRQKEVVATTRLERSPSKRQLEEEYTKIAALEPRSSIPQNQLAREAMIMNYDLDPYEFSDEELQANIVAMFHFYGILRIMQIPPQNLVSFVRAVCASYNPPDKVLFHNFKHIYNVVHLTFHLLVNGVDAELTIFNVFALLVAALCHDMDHPGLNNAHMIATRSELALLYANDSVLERHHAYMMQRLLLAGSTTMPPTDLLCSLDEVGKAQFTVMVTNAILATDMSHHFKKVNYLVDRAQRSGMTLTSEDDDRIDLLCVMLHAADIGAQTQTTKVALSWADRVCREFSAQHDRELALGLPPTIFMADLDEQSHKGMLQAAFISDVVLPLWKAAEDNFPKLAPQVKMLEQNMQVYDEMSHSRG